MTAWISRRYDSDASISSAASKPAPDSLNEADPIAVMMRLISDGECSTYATSCRETPACSAARSMISSFMY
jgi:hypothetical protein